MLPAPPRFSYETHFAVSKASQPPEPSILAQSCYDSVTAKRVFLDTAAY